MIILKQTKAASNQSVKLEGAIFGSVMKIIFLKNKMFSFRYFYYCLLFFLPLTILFLAWHLFVENAKWAQSEDVPRPWPHTIYIPLIWFFSAAFAVPTAFWSQVRPWKGDADENDFYRNNEFSWRNAEESQVISNTYIPNFFGL